jgi:hypothetical protein
VISSLEQIKNFLVARFRFRAAPQRRAAPSPLSISTQCFDPHLQLEGDKEPQKYWTSLINIASRTASQSEKGEGSGLRCFIETTPMVSLESDIWGKPTFQVITSLNIDAVGSPRQMSHCSFPNSSARSQTNPASLE